MRSSRRRIFASALALVCLAAVAGSTALPAAAKRKPPKPVPAWYMTASNVPDLVRQAKSSACVFAKRQTKGERLMLFDFGAAQKYRDGTYGASLRQIRRFRNNGILKALKNAARKYDRCHRRGSATIAYANTNSMPGYMSKADAYEAGLHQAATIRRLRKFQHTEHDFDDQSVAGAGDIEPGWGYPGVSKALVRGANGRITYYDFGNAGGCPGQPGADGCYNGWDLGDLGEVSIGRRSVPLPEIYRPHEAVQWARIQRAWDGRYFFAGVTGAPNEPLSPREGWSLLRRRADRVHRELVSIRDAGVRGARAAGEQGGSGESPGGPMSATTPAHLVVDPEGFFSTSLIYPLRNEWVASDRRRFVAVDAGADPLDPSTGVLGVFRQNYVEVTQTQRVIRVPGAGPIELTAAPTGRARAALAEPGATLRFRGESGVAGTIDVRSGEVVVEGSG